MSQGRKYVHCAVLVLEFLEEAGAAPGAGASPTFHRHLVCVVGIVFTLFCTGGLELISLHDSDSVSEACQLGLGIIGFHTPSNSNSFSALDHLKTKFTETFSIHT